MNKVLRLQENKIGRDITVTDVHGMFHLLRQALDAINFDGRRDRLIAIGDLVDRGPYSHVVAEWLNAPWFFSAMGNHDAQYAFEERRKIFKKKHGSMVLDPCDRENWICLPVSTWYMDLPNPDEAECIFKTIYEKTYPAIEIETGEGIIGFVHAAVPENLNWTELCTELNNENFKVFKRAVTDRTLARIAQEKSENGVNEDDYLISDALHVFHGHTIGKDCTPYSIANRYYIDTGAYKTQKKEHSPNAGITLFDIKNPKNPLYPSSWK